MKRNLLSLLFIVFVTSVFAQVPSYVPSDGLVGWWPFNGDAADESGNGNDGTVNGATLTADRNGNLNSAFSFNNATISVPHNSAFGIDENEGHSISLWAFMTGDQSVQHLVGKRPDGAQQFNWQLGFNYPANYGLSYGGVGSGVFFGLVSQYQIPLNNWIHIICTYQANTCSLYIDGVLYLETTTNNFYDDVNCPLTFGNSGNFQAYLGNLDDIGIWNRALTEQEVELLYNGCSVSPTAIVGEDAPLNFSTANYFCNDNPGSIFTWEVSNGIISSGQGTNSIVVLWGNEGAGTVSVVETNAEGCDGPTASFNVNVQCSSNISSITGNLSPVVLTSTSYTVNGPADSEYQWTVTNGVITSGQGTSSVNVIWAAEGEGTLTVIETTNTGCESPVLTITTNAVITYVLEEKQSVLSIYPNPVNDQLTIFSQQNLLGQNYQLFDAFGRVVMQGVINNSSTTLNTQALSAGVYFLVIDNEVNKIEKLN